MDLTARGYATCENMQNNLHLCYLTICNARFTLCGIDAVSTGKQLPTFRNYLLHPSSWPNSSWSLCCGCYSFIKLEQYIHIQSLPKRTPQFVTPVTFEGKHAWLCCYSKCNRQLKHFYWHKLGAHRYCRSSFDYVFCAISTAYIDRQTALFRTKNGYFLWLTIKPRGYTPPCWIWKKSSMFDTMSQYGKSQRALRCHIILRCTSVIWKARCSILSWTTLAHFTSWQPTSWHILTL